MYYERKAEKKEDIQRRRGLKLKKYKIAAAMLGICMATVIMWFVSYVLLGGVHLLG